MCTKVKPIIAAFFAAKNGKLPGGGTGNSTFIEGGQTYQAYNKFKEMYLLLQKIARQNPTDEEIEYFVQQLLDITL